MSKVEEKRELSDVYEALVEVAGKVIELGGEIEQW